MQAASRSPWYGVASIGPVTSCTEGMSDDAAAISCAGTVLSQPPISTALSIGWPDSMASVSSAARLRKCIDVGNKEGSHSDTVGNASGSPPAASTPRFTASISSGTVRWQLL